jgi:hypothetical protein
MKALLWKEMRERRGLFLGVAGVTVVAAFGCVLGRVGADMFAAVWLFLSPLLAALWGAEALARETSVGTLEWLGSLPVSRPRLWVVRAGGGWLALLALYALALGLATWLGGLKGLLVGATVPELVQGLAADLGAVFLAYALSLNVSGTRRRPFEALLLAALLGLALIVVWLFLVAEVLPRFWGPVLGLGVASLTPGALGWTCLLLGLGWLAASGLGWTALPVLAERGRRRRTWAWTAALVPLSFGLYLTGVRYEGAPSPRDLGHIDPGVTASPDGRWLAFQAGSRSYSSFGAAQDLWLLRADGTGLRCLARGQAELGGWTPDSRQVLFEWEGISKELGLPGGGSRDFYWAAQVPSGRLLRLSQARYEATPTEAESPFAPQAFATVHNLHSEQFNHVVDLAPSPATGTVAFLADFRTPRPRRRGEIHAKGWDEFVESPPTLWLVAADGTSLRRVATDRAPDRLAGWTSDGRLLGLVSLGFDDRLVSLNPDTGEQKVLLEVSPRPEEEAR